MKPEAYLDDDAELVFPMVFTCKFCKRLTVFSDNICSECTSEDALE